MTSFSETVETKGITLRASLKHESMDRSVNCGIFRHRCFEASEEMGQCCYCWLLKVPGTTKTQGFFNRNQRSKSPQKRPLTIQCIFPLFEVQGGCPAPGQMAFLSFLKHMNTCSILFYHILFDGFCPGKPMILGRQEDCVCAQMREQACSCPDGLAEHPSSTSNNVGCDPNLGPPN